MPDSFAHATYLAVASFADRDEQHAVAIAPAFVDEYHRRGQRATPLERHAMTKAFQRLLVRHTRNTRLVCAFDAVPRMRETRGEITVVGQQQQALAVVVETPNRINVFAHAL